MAALSRRMFLATPKPAIYSFFTRPILTGPSCTRILTNGSPGNTLSPPGAGGLICKRHYDSKKVLPSSWGRFLAANGRFKYWNVDTWDIIKERSLSRDEKIEIYVNLLADAIGSVDEARKRIHSVSTQHSHYFVCDVPLGIAAKIREKNPEVLVKPLSDADVERTDYYFTGEPFINGKAVPYDPKYHKALLDACMPSGKFPRWRERFSKNKKKPECVSPPTEKCAM